MLRFEQEAELQAHHESKHQFVKLNQTIALNDLKAVLMSKIHKIKDGIHDAQVKIDINVLQINRIESEVVDLRTKGMIFKFKLKEIYIDLMKNPSKLM